ncbi:MAG: hypothetical protein A2252_03240 [Elusimicrobia bacterium RIFOXYA2_FULL_39_19]|nr:MAG: hypothetical protein A2252_03240 [Elusimicrobia bacterium RIFOXYA2_FULL_39_19]
MNCENYKELLSAYVDNHLCAKEKAMVELHLNSCVYCRKELIELQSFVKALHTIKEKPLPPYYRTHLDAKLEEAAMSMKKTRIPLYFKWQLIFGVFFFGILIGGGTFFFTNRISNKSQITLQTIKIGEVGILSFNLYSKENVKSIVFNVELPEGISLASNPHKKTFSWEGELVKGENVISLYVKGKSEGKWAVNANLTEENIVLKEFVLPLQVIEKKG